MTGQMAKYQKVEVSKGRVRRATPFRRNRKGALVLASIWTIVAAGCSDRNEDPHHEQSSTAPPPSTTVQRGPVTLTVTASDATIDVGQPFTLTIDVEAETGVDITMPTLDEAVGPFAIQDARTGPGIPDNDRRRWSHIYTVDTFDTGDVEIPPITVTFVDARDSDPDMDLDAETITNELTSELFTITVRSFLPDDSANMEQRDIRGLADIHLDPESAEDEHDRPWLTVLIVVGSIAFLAILFLARRRRAVAAAEIVLLPHEWAMRELQRLAADHLIENDQLEPFYDRLSHIVRTYIERRFGLMAPERTTDEFLQEARRDRRLSDHHRQLLAEFLRSADLVKFALYEPPAGEGEAAFDEARSFVKQTVPPDQLADQPAEAVA